MGYSQLFSQWMEELLTHSTFIGRVWLSVLFLFRVFVLIVEAGVLPPDTARDIVCDTEQPGCNKVCNDHFIPVAPVRFWVAQFIIASTPTLLYLAYTLHVVYAEGEATKGNNREPSARVSRSVTCSYFAQLLVKILLEVAFIIGQWFTYGLVMRGTLSCNVSPCPHRVDCFLPRSTEMTVFSICMVVLAGTSAALNALEGLLLFIKLRRRRQNRGLPSSCFTESYDMKQSNE
ncbi:gap junction Cx32.2 protein-like [Hoplias malabaricus]|uniref:gap junction Cx32.2 protein-like n=1 Tax=Hoplias malabaricus TaxID=27720 RepID=UPI0034636ABB